MIHSNHENNRNHFRSNEKFVCKIHIEDNNGTGFFMKIPYNNNHLTVLIANNHILNEIL